MGEEAPIPAFPGRQKRQRPVSHDGDRPTPSQRKRIQEITPGPLLCRSCTLMFSHQGLEHLNSPSGFRHRTRAECTASGNEGCGLCKFILLSLVINEEHYTNWASDDGLIFRNFRSTNSTSNTSSIQLPGIYGLKGILESEPDKCIITIYPFAKKGKHLCHPLYEATIIAPNKTQAAPWEISYAGGLSTGMCEAAMCLRQHSPSSKSV